MQNFSAFRSFAFLVQWFGSFFYVFLKMEVINEADPIQREPKPKKITKNVENWKKTIRKNQKLKVKEPRIDFFLV